MAGRHIHGSLVRGARSMCTLNFKLEPYKRKGVKWVPPQDAEEHHFPGYNYCGPGTNYSRRIRDKVRPVNALDAAAMEHDKYTEARGPQLARTPSEVWAADKRLAREAARILTRTRSEQLQRDCKAVIVAMRFNKWRKSRGGMLDV